jgi:hypothetical protein
MNEYTSSCIYRFIVCNPTTREWRTLPVPRNHDHPYVHPNDSRFRYTTLLAFDPSWSAQFYVFRFQEKFNKSRSLGICQLEVFSPSLSTWFVDDSQCWDRDAWGPNPIILIGKSHHFMGGVLHLQTSSHKILVVEGLEAMSYRMPLPPHHFTTMLPHDHCRLKVGCFGQSSGLLQCAFQEEGGRTITIFSLDSYRPCKWSLKHRLCMQDALGRDDFIRSGDSWPLFCDYKIIAFDLEKGVLLLVDDNLMKLLSYNINTGKLGGVKNGQLNLAFGHYYYYVACYSKLPRMSRSCGELSSK